MRRFPRGKGTVCRPVVFAAVLLLGHTAGVDADAILLSESRQISTAVAVSDGVTGSTEADAKSPSAPFSMWNEFLLLDVSTATGTAVGSVAQNSGYILTGTSMASGLLGTLSAGADLTLSTSADVGIVFGTSSLLTSFSLLMPHVFTLSGTLFGSDAAEAGFFLLGPQTFAFSSSSPTSTFSESGTLPAGDYELLVNVFVQLGGAEGASLTGPLDAQALASASFALDLTEQPSAVPEPASLMLLAVGLSGLAVRLRRH